MCGIAGYSVRSRSRADRTLAAQALLAAIAERGADAVGYAYRGATDTYPTVVKQRTPASQLLERVAVPAEATQLLVHVRDYTKGHPSIAANNHPVRHGPVVGIHNGIITNDDELLAPYSCARAEPRMTVDSEAIFALAAHSRNDARALEDLRGAMATAWLDEREPGVVFVARGSGRPLWLGEGRDAVFFASTKLALEVVERYCDLKLKKREVREGTLLRLEDGLVTLGERFRPDRDYVEADPLPAVRAPHEAKACLSMLAGLAAA
jgi:glucosamine 6-phosphate synthetase-like amidotransferase/phosphosugar isomerase protein